MSEQYSWNNCEEGLWWHGMDKAGRELFENKDKRAEFGKTARQMSGSNWQDKNIIRFRFSRDQVSPYVEKGGAILVLDPKKLTDEQHRAYGPHSDRYVLAEAVLNNAELRENEPGTADAGANDDKKG